LPRRFLSISSFQKTFVIRVMSAKLTLFLCLLATRGPSPVERKTRGQSQPRLLMFRNNLNVSIVLPTTTISPFSFFLSAFAGLCSFVRFVPSMNSDPIFRLFFSLSLRQRPRKIPKIDEKKRKFYFYWTAFRERRKKKFHWPPFKYLSFSSA
jgi:hypothetical protein